MTVAELRAKLLKMEEEGEIDPSFLVVMKDWPNDTIDLRRDEKDEVLEIFAVNC